MPDLLVFPQETVLLAIDPDEAIERVRHGFVEYAGNGLWSLEEDIYNPEEWATLLKNWMAAFWKASLKKQTCRLGCRRRASRPLTRMV